VLAGVIKPHSCAGRGTYHSSLIDAGLFPNLTKALLGIAVELSDVIVGRLHPALFNLR
jgi:hypothetical protein